MVLALVLVATLGLTAYLAIRARREEPKLRPIRVERDAERDRPRRR